MMSTVTDDILVITEKDLCYSKKVCKGFTLKGKQCKNKVFEEYDYCKIHYQKFRLEKPDECPVCSEDITNVQVPLSCSHWVHRNCVVKWGKEKCPVCMSDIKLTTNERKKIHKNSTEEEEFEDDILLPQPLLDLLESIIHSFPEEVLNGYIIDINTEDNSIMLIDDFDDEEVESEEVNSVENNTST